jgi:hypothetical protein
MLGPLGTIWFRREMLNQALPVFGKTLSFCFSVFFPVGVWFFIPMEIS